MLLSYKDCISKYGDDYHIHKAIALRQLYKIKRGIYSTDKYPSELETIRFSYPNAVLTMDSAFSYYNLTDAISDTYHFATLKDTSKIKDTNVKQYFIPTEYFSVGKSVQQYQGFSIKIYDLERMLIELIRNRKKLPFDYYKEIIHNYRNRLQSLDISKLQEYLSHFPNSESIFESIQLEVM